MISAWSSRYNVLSTVWSQEIKFYLIPSITSFKICNIYMFASPNKSSMSVDNQKGGKSARSSHGSYHGCGMVAPYLHLKTVLH